MKVNPMAAAIALALLMVGNTVIVSVSADTANQTTPTSATLSKVTQFIGTLPPDDNNLPLCLSGTVNPFTIKDNSCPKLKSMPQTAYTLACDSSPGYACQAGSRWTPSTNDSYVTASATVPSTLPSVTYYAGSLTHDATTSDWLGLQSCVVTSCSYVYLLQVGVYYGINSSYTSQKPVLFEELWSNFHDSGCLTGDALCAYTSAAVSAGDSLYFTINEETSNSPCLGGGAYWALFSEDTTANIYQTYTVCVGPDTGIFDTPYSSVHYVLTTAEGGYAATSGYFPSNFAFSAIWGTTSSGTDQLGTRSKWEFTNATGTGTVTATVSYSTYSCTYGTCGQSSTSW
jgi:hypothetical protein